MGKKRRTRKTWTAKENTRACREQGWAIFECANAPGAPDYSADTDPRIQRDDDTNAFAYDEDVYRFVWQTAQGPGDGKGNKLARRALAHVKRENPEHYAEIKAEGEKADR